MYIRYLEGPTKSPGRLRGEGQDQNKKTLNDSVLLISFLILLVPTPYHEI